MAVMNFRERIETFGRYFFLLRPTHPTLGIEPGCRIEVYDYSMSFVSSILDTLPC